MKDCPFGVPNAISARALSYGFHPDIQLEFYTKRKFRQGLVNDLEPQPNRIKLPNQGESLAEIAKKLFPCAETTGNGSYSNNDVRRIRKTTQHNLRRMFRSLRLTGDL